MHLSTLAAWTLLSSASIAAPPESGDGISVPCWNGGTTAGIQRCFAESGSKANADLNRTYVHIMSVLPADDRRRLQKAERLWVSYRTATCDAEYQLWNGGTGGPPAEAACIDTETRHRLDYLRTTYRLRLQRPGR